MIVIDVGNTKTGIGWFQNEKLIHQWKISTEPNRTADEYLIIFDNLLKGENENFRKTEGTIVASVVPKVTHQLQGLRRYTDIHFVSHRTPLSFTIDIEQPETVGPDRIASMEGAVRKYGCPVMVIDAGTAITMTAINENKSFIGGTISPGIGVSLDALFSKAARLMQSEVYQPKHLIGRTTEEAIGSGVHFGFASLIDGIIRRGRKELSDQPVKVIGCGGAIQSIAAYMEEKITIDRSLTMEGLFYLLQNLRNGTHPDA